MIEFKRKHVMNLIINHVWFHPTFIINYIRMKKTAYMMIILLIIMPVSCKQTQAPREETSSANSIMLTEDEKKGGIMTPEILWEFGRLGSFSLSPDGSSVIYRNIY